MPKTIRRAMSVFFVLTGAIVLAAPSVADAQARGRTSGGSSAPSRASAGPSAPAPSAVAPSRAGSVVSRGPGGQPATGGAVTRTPGSGPVIIGHPIYGGSPYYGYGYGYPYYPYYGYGYGYPYYGFAFGFGYPYPYYGYPYYGYTGSAYYGPAVSVGVQVNGGAAVHSEASANYTPPARMGSIRLRINPSDAQVYVDGALAGTVDDFNGLSSHLELEAGPHSLEVRAKGFQTYRTEMHVDADRTTTLRASLTKNKY